MLLSREFIFIFLFLIFSYYLSFATSIISMYLLSDQLVQSAKRNLLYFNLTLLFLVPFSGQCQKDLRMHLLAPVMGQDIIRYQPFMFKVKIENPGPLKIKANDIIEIGIQLFGNYVYSAKIPPTELEVGDSVEYSDEISFNFSAEYHNEDFCSIVSIYNNTDPTPLDAIECYPVDLLLKPTATINLEESSDKLVVFPNPTSGIFHLKLDNLKHEVLNITVYDFAGGPIYKTKSDKTDLQINMTDKPRGQYYLVASGRSSVSTKKIIIE